MSGSTTAGLVGEVEFDPQTTTVDAIQRAAYRLSDRLSVDVQSGKTITCRLFSTTGEPAADLVSAFRNEVLDQVLRARIRDETAGARNVILALAFSQTGTLDVS